MGAGAECGAVSGQKVGHGSLGGEAEDRESVITGMGWDGLHCRSLIGILCRTWHETRRSDVGHEYRSE